MPPEARQHAWRDADWLESEAARAAWRAGRERVAFVHPLWLATWWRVYAHAEARPCVWVEGDAGGFERAPPVAYAAWTVETRRLPAGVTVRRLQPLGQSAWTQDAFPGEYSAFGGAVDPATARRALDATLALEWDELVLHRVPRHGALAQALAGWGGDAVRTCDVVDAAPSWRLRTTGDVRDYLAALPAGERRAMCARNARARVSYVPEGGSLGQLFELHDRRWGTSGMPPRVRQFLDALAAACAAGSDVQLRVSRLVHAGAPCSARLLLECDGATHDLQAGFDPTALRAASLGKLHLGFEIERAFAAPGTHAFDLLAGQGMRADYKVRLAAEPVPLCDVHVVRSRWLHALRGVRRYRAALRSRLSAASAVRSQRSRARRTPPGDAPR